MILTIDEAAAKLRVSPRTIEREIGDGKKRWAAGFRIRQGGLDDQPSEPRRILDGRC